MAAESAIGSTCIIEKICARLELNLQPGCTKLLPSWSSRDSQVFGIDMLLQARMWLQVEEEETQRESFKIYMAWRRKSIMAT